YRLNPLTYLVVKGFGMLKVSRYSLPNVLAGEDLVPELMQDACTPEALADAALRYFREPALGDRLLPRYVKIHAQLKKDASREAAAAIAELLHSAQA
ncbi:MAG TPA: lipid-A-disaccharide synthase, partial [Xanthomonadales bacterium]|nr:lipid-A-disaccharide synthase [Xanthomonadales bacterium]